jgi:hypothetical protein
MIFEILSQPRVFAFSIAGDDSTHYESSYFDIRIRVGINGVLHNLHLVIVLFYGQSYYGQHLSTNYEDTGCLIPDVVRQIDLGE